MEIDLQDNKSVDSFKGEMDLVKEDDDEIVVPQKERLAKMLEKIKNSNIENKEEPQQNNQVLRAGRPNASIPAAPKKITPIVIEPFIPNFNLNDRYFYQNISANEWNEITSFLDKFVSDEKLNEKDLDEFFDSHPKIVKGNVSKLQGSVGDIFSKNKNVKKYKILTNYLIKKFYKPKPVICECYFFPNAANEQRVVNMFRTCKKTLDIAIFTFTRDSICQAIVEAHQRGIKIRCIGDDGNSKVRGSDVRLLASLGIPCKTDNNLRFHMHNKMAILDNSVVITGSFNWTNQAVNKNQENILFIEDKNIANQYTQYYNELWNSFDTVITPEEAKKYIEEEKKNNQCFNNYSFLNKDNADKKNVKTTTTKEKTEKKEEKTEKAEKTEKKQEKAEKTAKTTTKKEKTEKKEKTTTKKEKATDSKEKKTTTTKAKEKTTKEKSKGKDTKEKKTKTMKETKKASSTKSKSKEKTNKTTKAKTTPKTTKEKKKEKVAKSKTTTTKRVRGVKSTTKSSQKKKK